MAFRRGRVAAGGVVAAVLTLFAGHWVALFLSDRWWAGVVDPAAVPFLTRWHLLSLLLQLGGVGLAALWCTAHLLLVVGSISTVQVPRRLGDLEIREILPKDRLRQGAIIAGFLLGVLVAGDTGALLPLVLQGWRGVRYGVTDPVLGIDVGVYVAQLPLWVAGLDLCRRMVWVALGGAALCHFLVGGVRVSRQGVAMTDAARVQLGLLVAMTLALAAMGEGIGPLRAVAGLDTGAIAALSPATRWGVATTWGVAGIAVALWTFRPRPGLMLIGLGLWMTSGLLSRVVAPGATPFAALPADSIRPIAALATGLERLREERAPADGEPWVIPPAGLWDPGGISRLLQADGGGILALAPRLVPHGGARVPSWLALRRTPTGIELVSIADDRLAPGGAPVSFRDDDPADYPGLVSWRPLDPLVLFPGRGDTLATGVGGIPLGGALRRLMLAWGTQSGGLLRATPSGASLHWRLSPRERAAELFPVAWWGGGRPLIVDGALYWLVDGWLVGDGAPLAPAIPWEGGERRYLRPAFTALIDGVTGTTRLYLRPESDPLARAWAATSGGAIAPADSLPAEARATPTSSLALAVQGYAVLHGAYGFRPEPGAPLEEPALILPATLWMGEGEAAPELPLAAPKVTERGARLDGLLLAAPDGGVRLIRWDAGAAPPRPRTLETEWQRFATYERLQDSVTGSGGRLLPGPVRYDVGPRGTLAVQVLYAVTAAGTPSIVWVQVARGARLGAARTPATAWANLRGESAPLVPAPDLPDALSEARRWAARADSLLRAGDLEGFGRAFAALKRVLGTP